MKDADAQSRTGILGSPLPRVEDFRFLTGSGCYVADMKIPGMAHAVMVRSAVPHGRIRAIRKDAALRMPGVVGVITCEDIRQWARPITIWSAPLPGLERFPQMPLAADHVRYVGEPIALVVADDPYLAEDAAEHVEVEYDMLDPVTDVHSSASGKSTVHPDVGTNVACHYYLENGDVEAALSRASYRRKETFKVHRHSAVPLETRGLVAQWDAASAYMRVWGATKIPFRNRSVLAGMLKLKEESVELIEVDVGGSFGVRGDFYPEDFLVPFAARHFSRPVKWIEDRREHLIATNHSREMECELEIGVDANHRIVALRGRLMVDLGAYVRPNSGVGPSKTAVFLCGPYQIANSALDFNALITNKTPVGSYRGPGRYESSFFRERIVDLAARDLHIDPAEFRRINLIREDQMPWTAASLVPNLAPSKFDTGNYPSVLRRALQEFDYDGLVREQRLRGDGRLHGVGMGCFVESSGNGSETVRLAIKAAGRIELSTGSSSAGQGHETVMAQVAAEELGLPAACFSVFHGTTSLVDKGVGTFHSRSAVIGGNAAALCASRLRQRLIDVTAERAGIAADGLRYERGLIKRGDDVVTSVERLAREAERDSQLQERLDVSATFTAADLTYTFGTQLAHVAVDQETGKVEVLRFLTVEDIGRALNPAIVHGQTLGAAVQGISGTFLDHFVYDSHGQLLTGSFADYLQANSADFPNVEAISLEESPSSTNPLGVKGAGEGGIAATGAALANAVADALEPLGIVIRELPLSPNNLMKLRRSARKEQ